MAEELGTKDVLEQVHARLGNVEQDVRDLRTEMRSGFGRVDDKIDGLRSEVSLKFDTQLRWIVGFVFAGWITLMTSIWLKQ